VAQFMKYLLGNLSRKLGPLCRPAWRGRFWERRYTASAVLDEPALEDRLVYVLSHGVKEGLVGRATEWEGLHCVDQVLDEKPRRFAWFNWTRRWKGKRKAGEAPRLGRYASEVQDDVELTLAPLPHWAEEVPERRQHRMKELVGQIEARAAAAREKPPMGQEAVRRQTTEARPRKERTARPLCHASSNEGRAGFKQVYRAFCEAFGEAAKRWLAGDVHAQFPVGAFRPFLYQVRIV